MKRIITNIVFSISALLCYNIILAQDPSAIVEFESTDQGVLVTRTDTSSVNASYSPAIGLLIFQNSDSTFYYYNGSFWESLISSSFAGDNMGHHMATENIQLKDYYLSNDGDDEGIAIDNSGNVGIATSSPASLLDVRGSATFNEDGIGEDFRIESDLQDHMFFLDASTDNIGIQSNSPDAPLHIEDDGESIRLDGVNPLISFYNDFLFNGYITQQVNDMILYNLTATGSMKFGTNTLTRMEISSAGNVGIGTSSPTALLDVRGDAIFNENGENADFKIESDNNSEMFFLDASTDRIGISTSTPSRDLHLVHGTGPGSAYGLNIQNAGVNNNEWTLYTFNNSGDFGLYFNGLIYGEFSSIDGSYTALSDLSRKENIIPLENVIEKIMELNPKKYHMIGSDSKKERCIGFIAQEVDSIFPEFVNTLNEDDEDQKLGINYAGLSVISIKAIQEQQKMIEDLQLEADKVDDLEKRIEYLENKLNALLKEE